MSENLTQQLPEDLLRLILARLDSLDARMTALEEKVDRRLQETRPIWEAVLKRLDAVEVRMAGLESEVRVGVRQIERRVTIMAVDLLEVRGSQSELEGRVAKLEPESKP